MSPDLGLREFGESGPWGSARLLRSRSTPSERDRDSDLRVTEFRVDDEDIEGILGLGATQHGSRGGLCRRFI